MDNLTEKSNLNAKRHGSFSGVARTLLSMMVRTIGLLSLKEEDRLKAGIYFGSKGQIEQAGSAQIYSPSTVDRLFNEK